VHKSNLRPQVDADLLGFKRDALALQRRELETGVSQNDGIIQRCGAIFARHSRPANRRMFSKISLNYDGVGVWDVHLSSPYLSLQWYCTAVCIITSSDSRLHDVQEQSCLRKSTSKLS
jgi:hypothetical protein